MVTEAQVWQALEDVKDPEVPVLSVVELGVINAVEVQGSAVRVALTPTFAGCPALHAMRAGIEDRLRQLGAQPVVVDIVLTPAWTSDRLTDAAREKLKAFGLAPPPRHGGLIQLIFSDEPAACPHCGSRNTQLKNRFGPTLCRAIHYCDDCRQPFEQFKAL